MEPERAIASMPVVISAVPIRNRRSVPEQKASAKGSEDRIQHDQTADADLQFDAVHQDGVEGSGNGETDVDFVRAGLTEPVSFEKNRF